VPIHVPASILGAVQTELGWRLEDFPRHTWGCPCPRRSSRWRHSRRLLPRSTSIFRGGVQSCSLHAAVWCCSTRYSMPLSPTPCARCSSHPPLCASSTGFAMTSFGTSPIVHPERAASWHGKTLPLQSGGGLGIRCMFTQTGACSSSCPIACTPITTLPGPGGSGRVPRGWWCRAAAPPFPVCTGNNSWH
jgi:hypothetical protein